MIDKRATSVAFFILLLLAFASVPVVLAQEAVYRCGNAYTNDTAQAKREKCTLLDRGAVVTLPSSHKRAMEVTKPSERRLAVQPPKRSEGTAIQRQRDDDARAVIESELNKTEAQLVQLQQQYQLLTTSPDLERKQILKQQIDRSESDRMSLKRELKR